MSRYPKKASRSLYKPRTGVGLGKGSHQAFQALTEPVIRIGQETKRTYGVCTRVGCLTCPTGRGVLDVSLCERQGLLVREQGVGVIAAVSQPSERDPLPPAPACGVWGTSRNFSSAFRGIGKSQLAVR
jgi:hypothetical protein